MSYSLKRVFGFSGTLCEKTSRLLSEREVLENSPENLEEESDSLDGDSDSNPDDSGGDSDSGGGSDSGGNSGGLTEGNQPRSVNRDDIALLKWRRLAGIE